MSLGPTEADARRAERVSREFEQRFGRRPEGVWAAPGRANLIGEHTDYNDGFVLPFALAHSAYAAAAARADGVLRFASVQTGEVSIAMTALTPGSLTGWSAYVGGAVWALRANHDVPVTGLDLLLDSDVPSGAGLSSSAAIECATVLAAAETFGAALTPIQLALCAQRAEVEMAGVPCGVMDQFASMCGALDMALFLDCRSLDVRLVPLRLQAARLELLIVDTCAPHRLASGEYAARRRDCHAAAAALGVKALRDASLEHLERAGLDERWHRRARHVITENHRVTQTVAALENGQVTSIGPFLRASHASLRDDFEVTVPELDTAVETALEVGALGARMMGGGFGGSVLALVPEGGSEGVFDAVSRAFRAKRFNAPRSFVASASRGARRLLP